MAHSFADVKRFKPIAGIREAIINMTLVDNYATAAGGYVITPTNLGFKGILQIEVDNVQLDGAGTPVPHALVAQPITSSVNWGLRWYQVSDGAEEGDGAADSVGEVVRLRVKGY